MAKRRVYVQTEYEDRSIAIYGSAWKCIRETYPPNTPIEELREAHKNLVSGSPVIVNDQFGDAWGDIAMELIY